MDKLEEIIESISASRKYRGLYRGTVERIVRDSIARASGRDPEDVARNLLHQVWGAFYTSRLNWDKLLARIGESLAAGTPIAETLLPILEMHSSTAERLPFLSDFYQRIFAVTGEPTSIVDHGCGLNPLTIPWMNLPPSTKYQAYDIDLGEIDFLNRAFALLGLTQAASSPADVLEVRDGSLDRSSQFVSVEFYLKLLPVLEHQESGASLKVLGNSTARYQVVSFPTASLSGRNRGMVDFYGSRFESQLRSLGWQFERLDFPGELVFVVQKQ